MKVKKATMNPYVQMPNNSSRLQSVTVVIPALNESGNLDRLLLLLEQTFRDLGFTLPVLLIDDGSTDNSPEILTRLSAKYGCLRVIRHQQRQGVTGVWKTALAHVTTDWIFWGQADLESDPRTDIPLLLSAYRPGIDAVAGWRQQRGDGKVCASKLANIACRSLFGLQIHDMNWIKLVRRDLLSAELLDKTTHRYLLAVLAGQGHQVTEVPTPWHPRYSGKSKFGSGRLLRSGIDFLKLLGLWFQGKVQRVDETQKQWIRESEEDIVLSLLGIDYEYCMVGQATGLPLN
ncbi:MAG: glycosyltransferase family 2 protein [Spirulina sp. SIO3F2]|nr:glycosyltransferase family 2 protein [Spirulina sp. SIO3F2]